MNKVYLDVYLFFRGNCREAMEFYKDIFGGELTIQSYKDAKMANAERPADSIMHARLEGGDIKLMASDTPGASAKSAKISLSLGGTDEKRITEIFDKLSKGGTVNSPLRKEFWGDTFGSLIDKFGIEWMVNITAQKD